MSNPNYCSALTLEHGCDKSKTSTGPLESQNGFSIDRVPFIAGDGTSNRMFLPLCAKPKTVALFQRRPMLLYRTIVDTLMTETGDLLIFIADGEVMVQAMMMNSSRSKSERKVAAVATLLKAHVERTLYAISRKRPELAARIAGVVDWATVAAAETCASTIEGLRRIMRNPAMEVNPPSTAALEAGLGETGAKIWTSIRRLVKNLYTQRTAGTSLASVFKGEGLAIKTSEPKLVKRYRALEESCVLELSSILAGFECEGIIYTEMRYLTPDARGMSFIGNSIKEIREALSAHAECPTTNDDVADDLRFLKRVASEDHGLMLLQIPKDAAQPKNAATPRIRMHTPRVHNPVASVA